MAEASIDAGTRELVLFRHRLARNLIEAAFLNLTFIAAAGCSPS